MDYENILPEVRELIEQAGMDLQNEMLDDGFKKMRQAIDMQADKFGEEHDSVLTCLFELGYAEGECQRYEDSINTFNRALDLCIKLHGEEHGDTANIYYLLAASNTAVKNYDKAIDYLTKLVSISTKLFGKDDEKTTEAQNQLSRLIASHGNIDEAVLKEIERVTDDEECFYRGSSYVNNNELHVAVKYFAKAAKLRYDNNKLDNNILEYLRALSVSLAELNQYEKSTTALNGLLDMTRKIVKPEEVDKETAIIYSFIAANEMYMEKYDEAISHMNKCVSMDIKNSGEQSEVVLRDYNMLANIYMNAERLDEALATDVILINLAAKSTSDIAKDIMINTYGGLVSIYEYKEQYDDALDNLNKMIHLMSHIYGEADAKTLQAYNHKLMLASNMHNDELIAETLQKIDEIRQADEANCGCHDHHDDCDCGCHDHHHDDCCCDCHADDEA